MASATLHGALFARTASFSGSAEVHYDRAVRRAGDACTDGGVPGGADGGSAGMADGGAPVDGGSSPDAGVAPDAGATVDAGGCSLCFECGGGQACLVPPGGASGVCGPCGGDLDCCPGQICQAGACISGF